MNNADPRILALEKQFSQFHIQLFNTLSHAQSAVMTTVQQGTDIDESNDDYQQLKRDFEVTVTVYQGNQEMQQRIRDTQALMRNPEVSNVHLTQLWAAAVSTLSCDRMLELIPDDLLSSQDVAGELLENHAMHLAKWEERLDNY